MVFFIFQFFVFVLITVYSVFLNAQTKFKINEDLSLKESDFIVIDYKQSSGEEGQVYHSCKGIEVKEALLVSEMNKSKYSERLVEFTLLVIKSFTGMPKMYNLKMDRGTYKTVSKFESDQKIKEVISFHQSQLKDIGHNYTWQLHKLCADRKVKGDDQVLCVHLQMSARESSQSLFKMFPVVQAFKRPMKDVSVQVAINAEDDEKQKLRTRVAELEQKLMLMNAALQKEEARNRGLQNQIQNGVMGFSARQGSANNYPEDSRFAQYFQQ